MYFLSKLSHSLCSDILISSHKCYDFKKQKNSPFLNKTTQDFADFWDFCGNFKAKTKMKDEGILKKKRSLS